jgi:hypothetical protein
VALHDVTWETCFLGRKSTPFAVKEYFALKNDPLIVPREGEYS